MPKLRLTQWKPTDQEDLGSILGFAVGFFSSGELSHGLYGLSDCVFQCPLSMPHPLLSSEGSPCTLPTLSQSTVAMCGVEKKPDIAISGIKGQLKKKQVIRFEVRICQNRLHGFKGIVTVTIATLFNKSILKHTWSLNLQRLKRDNIVRVNFDYCSPHFQLINVKIANVITFQYSAFS